MTGEPIQQPTDAPAGARFGRELGLRVASALVMGLAAIATAYWGGWPFAIFWLAAGLGVLWEWGSFVSPALAQRLLVVGAAAAATGLVTALLQGPLAVPFVGLLAVAGAAFGARPLWSVAGMLYAGSLSAGVILLRADPAWGLSAIVLLFAVVWSTDIGAYFGGRLIGGPKLWPRVSPKKTWSGALVGTAAAVLGGLAVASLTGVGRLLPIALICVLLSAGSQLGDLLESAIKRHFGAKDSGHLIPGHGGLMDRLDGFIVAVVIAAAIGCARGGLEAPARGLMIW